MDVSNSFITDKGLLSICGVTVTEVSVMNNLLLIENHCPSRWTLGREVLKRLRRRRRGER